MTHAEIGKCFFNIVTAIYCGTWTRWWAQVIILTSVSDIRLSPLSTNGLKNLVSLSENTVTHGSGAAPIDAFVGHKELRHW